MKYKANLKKTDEGYAVWVPDLPGCWSQGHTEEEALKNIKDAIQAYLETIDELSKGQEFHSIPLRWQVLQNNNIRLPSSITHDKLHYNV